MDLKSIGASPPRFESCRLRFVSKGKHFFTAIYNNYDRQLLSLTVCCTCPLTSSLIVFFNTALCSLYFCASLFAFFHPKDPKPWIFRVFSSRRESGDCGSAANSLSSLYIKPTIAQDVSLVFALKIPDLLVLKAMGRVCKL